MSALLSRQQQRRPPVSSSSSHPSKRPRLSSLSLSPLSASSSFRRPAVRGAKESSMASLPPIIPVANVPAAPARAPSTGNASVDPEDLRQTANVTVDSIPTYLKKDCVLFYAPECESLAQKIAETSGGSVELGRIRWRCVVFFFFDSGDGRRRRRQRRRGAAAAAADAGGGPY